MDKPIRHKDMDLIDEVRRIPCIACCSENPDLNIMDIFGHVQNECHHIKTRGAGGPDLAINCISLCREHHQEIHMIGNSAMCRKYGKVKKWFLSAGWVYDVTLDRWRHPGL